MATKEEDTNNTELNAKFKTMGQRGLEGEIWKKWTEHCLTYILQGISEFFTQTSDNCMVLRGYGSAVEDLKVPVADDVGDLDIMICPKSVDLMIHDEMIEYSVNPMHVKIKGTEHPVLSSCLVEGTEYVATSALKNFHSAIYGKSAPHMVNLLIRAIEIASRERWGNVVMQWKNKEACPALQVDYTQSFGPISGELEKLKNPQTLTNLDAREWEWLAHSFCKSRGVKYSKEHADVLKEYIEFAKEVQTSYFDKGLLSQPQTFPLLLQELVFSDRAKNIRDRIHDIESRKQNESGRKEDSMAEATTPKCGHDVTPENCHENESGTGEGEVSPGAFPFKDGFSATARNLDEDQRSTSSQPTMASALGVPSLSSGNQRSRQTTNVNEDANEKSDLNENGNEDLQREGQSDSSKEQQPTEDTALPTKAAQPNRKEEYEDFKTLSSQTDRFFEHLFKKEIEETPKSTDTTKAPIMGGFDLVPAFRSPGWPKVALEWIDRARKWPSPDIVHKIVQEGFHLVVKPPKNGGNPECDFRISFSHAEYLLIQDMNDIQRECYRCVKKYHRAYLKEPKGLVTYHLKNIFLKTVEETGAEMWTESNRAECVMKLLGNLLEALVTRDLRHFFVRSYNLLCADYFEDPEILDSLAENVVRILEDPIQSAKEVKEEKCTPNSGLAGNTASGQRHEEAEQSSSSGSTEGRKKPEMPTGPLEMGAIHQGSSSSTYSFHDLKDIYLSTGQELIDKAFKEDPLLNVSDYLEISLVESLREMIAKHNMKGGEVLKVFESFWGIVYWKVWMNPEPNMRRRMLDAFQGVIATMKYLVRQDDLAMENVEAIAARMLNPDAEDPLDLSNLCPAGIGTQVINRFLSSWERSPDQPQQTSMDDIPLD